MRSLSSRPSPRTARSRIALVAGATSLALAAAACSSDTQTPAPTPPSPATSGSEGPSAAQISEYTATPSKLFGTPGRNPFLVDISQAPVHPNSRYYLDNIRGQIAANRGSVPINTGHFNSSFFVAGPDTPRVRLGFTNCQDKPETPANLYDGEKYFEDVPIPADAVPAKGTDAALSIWSPSSDQLWEFWVTAKDAQGRWSACWGGRIDDLSRSGGVFPRPYGASASGLATIGSMISLDEARRHEIDHAMYLGLKQVKQENTWVYPANRSDGQDDHVSAVPMGTRLRLDPGVDVDTLGLTPLGAAIARAAQRYGFIVSESSGVVAVGAESGQSGSDRTDPWQQILGGTPDYAQLDGFPWDRMQVIEDDYAKPTDAPPDHVAPSEIPSAGTP